MNTRETVCPECAETNSAHRLWCKKCGAQIFHPPANTENSVDTEGKGLRESVELYERVLDDLEGLAKLGEVSVGMRRTIQGFYEDQLAQKREQKARLAQGQALEGLAGTVRKTVMSGRLQDAIATLKQGLQAFPGEPALRDMLTEVEAQLEQRERILQATRKARALLHESKQCFRTLQLEEAKRKLERATEFDPRNQEIIATLQRVKDRIEEQRVASEKQRLAEAERRLAEEEQRRAATTAATATEPVVVTAELAGEQPTVAAEIGSQAAATVHPHVEVPAAISPPIAASFAEEEIPSPTQRLIDAASQWSSVLKPFLLDNVGWFVGAFLVISGFVVLIVTFWTNIEQSQILVHSLVYLSLLLTTGMFFAAAYFMRLKYPELETSSNVLLVIVALLIPLVFAAAALTSLVPTAEHAVALLENLW